MFPRTSRRVTTATNFEGGKLLRYLFLEFGMTLDLAHVRDPFVIPRSITPPTTAHNLARTYLSNIISQNRQHLEVCGCHCIAPNPLRRSTHKHKLYSSKQLECGIASIASTYFNYGYGSAFFFSFFRSTKVKQLCLLPQVNQ